MHNRRDNSTPSTDRLSPLLQRPEEPLEGVKVFLRVRPPNDKEVLHRGGLAVTASSAEGSIAIEGKEHTVRCTYDVVFDHESAQSEVFERIKPAIAQVRAPPGQQLLQHNWPQP
jgi:hypothetical protein